MTSSPSLHRQFSLEQRAVLLQLLERPWKGQGWFPNVEGRPYRPSQGKDPDHGQLPFHRSKARYRVLRGGRGSGKTGAGAQEALQRIRKGLPGAVLNPDFENFKTSTWPEFRKWIPWQHVIKVDQRMAEPGWEPQRPFIVHFDNEATVICKGLKDPDSARGPNLNWLWYDEGGRDKTGEAWRLAVASVRVGEDPSAWVTTTPRGIRHWIYQNFVVGLTPPEVQKLLDEAGYAGRLYEVFYATIEDNKANLDPLFYASMLTAYSGRLAEQELGGKFVEIAEGLVFDEFDPSMGTGNVDDAEPNPELPIELAFDDGYIDPRAILFIQRTGTRIHVFDELYHSRHIAETCVGEVVDRCKDKGWSLPVLAVGSPEAKELQERFRRKNIPARGRPNKIIEGIEVVRRLIKDANGVRSLTVHPRCKNFIWELTEGYRYPEGATRSNTENPQDGDDHACEAFRNWSWLRARR